jgi:predicted phosphodiesterase
MINILTIPDVHIPYQDKRALNLAYKVAQTLKPEVIVFIGDFIDCYRVSEYTKDPTRQTNTKQELEQGRKILKQFAKCCDEYFFCQGNHEVRLQNYIASRAPELYGLISVQEELDIPRANWTSYREIKKIGKCHWSHEVGYCGLNSMRQSLDAFGGNLVYGHTHNAGILYSGNLRGERHFVMNVGWLGDLKFIDYAHKPRLKNSQLGVGIVQQDSRGTSYANFVPFVKNSANVLGNLVTL